MRIPALAAAAVLVFGLAACGNDTDSSPAETAAPAPATTTTTPAETTASPEASADASASASATADASAAVAEGDQSTPEAAAESALKAIGAGNIKGACQFVSDGTQPVAGNPQNEAACEQVLNGIVAGVPEEQMGALENVSVEGATVNGQQATFENATVNPPMPQLQQLKAVQIDNDWYLVFF